MRLKLILFATAVCLSSLLAVSCGGDGDSDASQADAQRLATATSLTNLGHLNLSQGELDQALPSFREALNIRESILGENHPDTAKSAHNLADLYLQLRQYSSALPLFQRAADARESILGTDHLDTASSLNGLGMALQGLGDYSGSVVPLERALKIRQQELGQDDPETVNSLINLAVAYQHGNDLEAALPLFERALQIAEEFLGPVHPTTASALENLAGLYFESGNSQPAFTLLERAVSIREQISGPNSLDTVTALDNLADLYFTTGDYPQARSLYQKSLQIRETALGPEHPDTAISLNNLGLVYRRTGDLGLALNAHQRALEIREKVLGPEHPDTATSLNNLAAIRTSEGDYQQALPLLQRSLSITENSLGPDHPNAAIARNNMADLFFRMADYARAKHLYQRALEIQEKALNPEDPDIASTLNNLAVLYKHLGDYAQALALYQRSLSINESALGLAHPDTAVSLDNLAELYVSMGDFDRAHTTYQRALDIIENAHGANDPQMATFLNNLGNSYFRTGEYDKALPLFKRALDIREQTLGPEHPQTATMLNNLAVLYRSRGNADLALPLYQQALEIRQKTLGPDHPETATSLNNLAALYSARGEFEQALPLYQQSLETVLRVLGSDHPNAAVVLNNLGMMFESAGDYDKALEFFERALSTEDRLFSNIFEVASEEQKLLFAQANQGNYHAILSLIQRHLQDNEAAVRTGMNMVLKRKAIVLDAQSLAQAAIAGGLEGESLESWQRLVQFRGNLANLQLRGPGDTTTEEYQKLITQLEASIAQEERFLADRSEPIAEQLATRQVTTQQLADILPSDSVLIEYVKIQDWSESKQAWADSHRYLAFALTPDARVRMADLGDSNQIDQAINDTLANINAPDYLTDLAGYTRDTDAALSNLYRLVVQPLGTAVRGKATLIVSPDGEINKVPFAALKESGGAYLIEGHTVAYVASGRDLAGKGKNTRSGPDLLMIANPNYDEREALPVSNASDETFRASNFNTQFLALPGTAIEADVIPPIVAGKQIILTGAEATEAALRSSPTPRILHLATHGFFLEDRALPLPSLVARSTLIQSGQERGAGGITSRPPPSETGIRDEEDFSPMVRSGLALAGANFAGQVTSGDDGILTALEVTGLNLHGTELVVLSACETAVGAVSNGEGVFGLRRAFKLAGAQNLVMSLWLVSDAVTVDQMEEFYVTFATGRSAADSLRQAQLKTIRKLRQITVAETGEELAPVKLWAPFIVQQTRI